ncbi:MAG: N-acetylmuramoyl-L-alanine amidase, partial [Lachnospiraceae bacterium]|nr:N-acetylmuramoyl-L-alanine amidase [Lachnospiraceae bacterium]
LDDRVALANGVDADLFISVHCNASTVKEGNGTEALYSTTQGKGDGFNSESLARLCVANLASALGTKLRGIVSGDDIRIVRNSKVPVTLLEVCFISNKNDLKLIKDENNRKNAAKSIYDSIIAAYDLLGKGISR